MDRLIRQLKSLPWRWLLQSAGVVIASLAAIELLLVPGFKYFPPLRRALSFLYSPPLGMLMPVLIAIGVGVLAVYLLELWDQRFLLNAGSLWALMGCLLLALAIKSLLPVPPILIDLSRLSFIGILIGVSWKGRPYFR
ncbi:MAG: peptide chain release factor 1 [Limnospira sp.]